MIRDIDHIALIVNDIKILSDLLNEIGISRKEIRDISEKGICIALHATPNMDIELVESIRTDGVAASAPQGIHHIGFTVHDIAETFESMKSDRRFIIEGSLQHGMHSKIFFFRIKAYESLLFECVEAHEKCKY